MKSRSWLAFWLISKLSFISEPKHKSGCVNSPSCTVKIKLAGGNGSVILLPCDVLDIALDEAFYKCGGKLSIYCPLSCGTCNEEIPLDWTAYFQGAVKLKNREWLKEKLTLEKRKNVPMKVLR